MFHKPRIARALSAFDRASKRWTAIPLHTPHDPVTQRPGPSPAVAHAVGRQTLSFTSWNIQANVYRHDERAELILDHVLQGPRFPVDNNGLVDAWVALHGNSPRPGRGATWGVGVELDNGRKPKRLDKVVMLGVRPDRIDVLQPGLTHSHLPWSDHCGLCCTFTI
ncbi:hypothetical protein APHAL10511_007542 [Amanita phalloides]|nr:hypothetical protein APHAL10511_007542 [Amanita phalloides]